MYCGLSKDESSQQKCFPTENNHLDCLQRVFFDQNLIQKSRFFEFHICSMFGLVLRSGVVSETMFDLEMIIYLQISKALIDQFGRGSGYNARNICSEFDKLHSVVLESRLIMTLVRLNTILNTAPEETVKFIIPRFRTRQAQAR